MLQKKIIHGKQGQMSAVLLLLGVALSILTGGAAQPTVTGEQWVDVGENATFYCASSSFSRLQWRKSGVGESNVGSSSPIMQYTVADGRVVYASGYDTGRYMFDKDNTQYPLTIVNFTEEDKGRYWCRVLIVGDTEDTLDVCVREPVTSVIISNGTESFKDGDTLVLEQGVTTEFNCTVTNVKPPAGFKWTLDSKTVSETEPPLTSCTADVSADYSINSVSVTPNVDQHKLECRAWNKAGDDGVAAYVSLKVEEPPETPTTVIPDGTAPTEGSQTSTVGSTSIGSSSPETMTPTTDTSTGSTKPTTDTSISTGSATPRTDTSTSSTGSTANQSSVSMSSSLSTSTPTPTHMTTNQSLIGGVSEDPGSGDLSTGAIIGIAVGGFAVVVILIAVVSGGVMWKMKSHKTAVKPGDAKSGNKESDGGKKNEQKKDDG